MTRHRYSPEPTLTLRRAMRSFHATLVGVVLVSLPLVGLVGCIEERMILTFDPGPVEPIHEAWSFLGKDGSRVTTEHYEIYATAPDEELLAYLPDFLETTFHYYASFFGPHAKAAVGEPMRVYLFHDRLEWDAFVQSNYPQRYKLYSKIMSGGFSEDGDCVVYDIGRSATLSLLAHEGLHQYIGSRFTEPVPAWVNEGLATYCESVDIRGTRPYFRPTYNTFRIEHLRDAFVGGETIPLRELLSTDAGQIIEGADITVTGTYYAQSWALVSYLRHSAGGRFAAGFQNLLDDIANGTIRIKAQAAKVASPSPSEVTYGEAVFRAYISTDLDGFERDFLQHVQNLCYPPNPHTAMLEPLIPSWWQ